MRHNTHNKAPFLFAVTAIVSFFMIAPMLLSVMAGLVNNYSVGLKSGLTTRWFVEVWDIYGGTVGWSLVLALVCVAGTVVLGVPCAYALARSRSRIARIFEELLTLPVAVPGLATALALILAYGQITAFRQSFAFILVGHIVFTLPFMVRSVLAVMLAIDLNTLEEGAASLGAGFRQRFFDIVLPNCRGGIVAGSLMVLTLSIGEFNMTWLLHTPFNKTLPVGLADAYASLRFEIGSAYTLVFFLMIVPLLLALQRVGRAATPNRRREKDVP